MDEMALVGRQIKTRAGRSPISKAGFGQEAGEGWEYSDLVGKMHINYYVLAIFAPLLILVGILGFVIPQHKGLTSGAAAYNIFHIIFGTIGVMIVFFDHDPSIRVFNIGFGLIDLYQAGASFAHIFPAKYFRWTRVDDVLHIVIGAALVAVGVFG